MITEIFIFSFFSVNTYFSTLNTDRSADWWPLCVHWLFRLTHPFFFGGASVIYIVFWSTASLESRQSQCQTFQGWKKNWFYCITKRVSSRTRKRYRRHREIAMSEHKSRQYLSELTSNVMKRRRARLRLSRTILKTLLSNRKQLRRSRSIWQDSQYVTSWSARQMESTWTEGWICVSAWQSECDYYVLKTSTTSPRARLGTST